MDELLAQHGVGAAAADHLHRLVADWQLLADLSFADLILFVPAADGAFVAVAQMRPTTGPTAYQDDVVGAVATSGRPQLRIAFDERRICREGDPMWLEGVPVRAEAIPVAVEGEPVAVVARDTNLTAARAPSRLELTYLDAAAVLAQMVAEGTWPAPGDAAGDGTGPRVGDGLLRLDAAGVVSYASPNALSAYRRLGLRGDLVGSRLDAVTRAVAVPDAAPVDEPVAVVAGGRLARLADVVGRDAAVQLRVIPLAAAGEHIGALVLVRDVTELRRRERQLLGKDATIREIHHRVKNNLQTVAALLRLQARRLEMPDARAALEESVRRVSSIAVVHETLSATVDGAVPFDDILDRLVALVAELAAPARVRLQRSGAAGVLPAEVATPLALVVTELLQNAAEHGYDERSIGGTIELHAERAGRQLQVEVRDDGRGLPVGFDLAKAGLGLQIVRTLVESELGGALALGAASYGAGVSARVSVRVPD